MPTPKRKVALQVVGISAAFGFLIQWFIDLFRQV